MIQKYYLVICLFIAFSSFSQSKYKTQYVIIDKICYTRDIDKNTVQYIDSVSLVKDVKVNFDQLPEQEQRKILDKIGDLKQIKFKEDIDLGGNTVSIERTLNIDDYLNSQKFATTQKYNQKATVGYVKFEDDKLYLNPYINPNEANFKRDVYYYKLKNRQTVQLDFTEWVVSALAIPLKYRFDPGTKATSEFSVDFNANLFGGYTTGSTKFLHREKVGNKEFKSYFTTGAYIGVSTTTLNATNTSRAKTPLVDTEATTGLFSIGGGLGGGIDKISIMGFIGFDFAVGTKSELWNFNGVPYIGLGLGYDIFKFN